jgi:VanZ family protein
MSSGLNPSAPANPASAVDALPRSRALVILLWIAVLAWMAGVTWLSSKPSSFFPKEDIPNLDKIVHGVLYTTGAFFAAGSMLVSFAWRKRVIFAITIVAISAFGALDEYHQLSTPGRSGGDVGDWTADTLGAVLGVLCVMGALRFLRHRRPTRKPPATS